MYVLSDSREFLPKNVEGDIYIGGVGVADGYQNDQKQTDAAFINHKTLGRIYRTGDRGYISDEGCMEFCGRQDMQVKINGLRIELGDLDSRYQALKIPFPLFKQMMRAVILSAHIFAVTAKLSMQNLMQMILR